MTVEELSALRLGAELQNLRPYLKMDIEQQINGVMNSVSALVNKNELTPELAMLKWMEVITLRRILTRADQRIAPTEGDKH